MPVVPVTPRVRNPPLRWRLSVDKLTAPQLGRVRRAMSGMQRLSDDRGYQRFAGIHGLPLPVYCQHSTDEGFAQLFLPWHRAYLYFFERALRDVVPSVAHPWWDWTRPSPQNKGIPAAYADQDDADGNPNPLSRAQIGDEAMRQARRAGIDLPNVTRRQPGLPGTRLPRKEQVDALINERDFWTFSNKIEDLHGRVHVYVGGQAGHMTQIALAAYDPIFWAHHTMIDRIWRLWELKNGHPSFTSAFLGTALPPFPMTVAQTLSVEALGYDYAGGAATTPAGGG
jgi:tyrosinase